MIKKTVISKGATKKPPYVVVRTYTAGVHCGELVSLKGKEVALSNTKRIWSWTGAWTLNEIASVGPGEGSKISCAAPSNTLTEAIEVLECTPAARAKLEAASWPNK